jgi:hypothetical protein
MSTAIAARPGRPIGHAVGHGAAEDRWQGESGNVEIQTRLAAAETRDRVVNTGEGGDHDHLFIA